MAKVNLVSPAAQAILLCATATALALQAGATPPKKKAPPLTTADKWAMTIASVVGGPDLLHVTQQQMARKLKHADPPFKTTEIEHEISAESPQSGVKDFVAGFEGTQLDRMKINIERTDPEGHELYPRLRRLLAARFVRPLWEPLPGWDRPGPDGNKEAGFHYARGHYELKLTDTGWSLTLELEYIENDNEVP